MNRTTNAVNGRLGLTERQIHCWGRTSGGGTPTLDTPSWGSSSITDAGTGLLDVTMERATGGANYPIIAQVQSTVVNYAFPLINATTAPTSTVFRISALGTSANTDPTIGYHWIVYST